jgi:hypothetical protein
MKSFLFLILILASSVWCYQNYGQNLPVHTTLSHLDGRSMEVMLLSREQTQVTFKRQSDGLRLSCGIRDLSIWSKCKVYWNFRSSNGKLGDQAKRSIVGDFHLQGIREEIQNLIEDLNMANYRLNAAGSIAEERTMENAIAALELSIEKLKLKEAEHIRHRN